MLLRMANTNAAQLLNLFAGALTVYLFSGDMPVVDDNFTFTPLNYSAQQLAKFSSVSLSIDSSKALLYLSSTTQPSTIATKSGVASWFAIVYQDSASQWSKAMFGSVTDQPTSNDPMLLDKLNVVANAAVAIIDVKFQFGM